MVGGITKSRVKFTRGILHAECDIEFWITGN